MKHIKPINEFFKTKKKTEIALTDSGWLSWEERAPDKYNVLQSANGYHMKDGERVLSGGRFPDRISIKYKVVKDGRVKNDGYLYENSITDLDKISDLKKIGDLFWYDFTDYKLQMESLMKEHGYKIGSPVEITNIDNILKDLIGGFSDLKDVYKKDLLGKKFIIKNTAIHVVGDKLEGLVLIPEAAPKPWIYLSNVKI